MISISKGVAIVNPTKSASKRIASHDMRSFTNNLPSSLMTFLNSLFKIGSWPYSKVVLVVVVKVMVVAVIDVQVVVSVSVEYVVSVVVVCVCVVYVVIVE